MAEIHEGGCLCGAVRYKVTGEPRSVIVCHCAHCKRSTGSAFSFTAVFSKEHVEFDEGLVATYEFQSPDHNRTISVKFCTRCGARIVGGLQRVPAVWFVYAGGLDDPNWLKVSAHTYTRSAVNWMTFPPGVPCFSENVWDEEGKPTTPLPAQSKPWRKADLVG